MNRKAHRRFVSLNLKMTAAIMMGIVLAIGVFFLCEGVENYIAEEKYLSDEAVEKNVGAKYDSLIEYIKKYNVKATDTKALSEWMKEQQYTYFFVYDNYSNIYEAGWWTMSNGDEEDPLAGEKPVVGTVSSDETRIDEDTFSSDVKNRIIDFKDGKYYVYIDSYKEQQLYEIMNLIKVIFCFLTLLITLLVYNGGVIRRVIKLAGEVQNISDGNLMDDIHAVHNDEIGALALSVETMRDSIIEKHRNEKEAWDANTQLITAMSHDIRTPLTSMIGYLDIIEGKKYSSQEELDKYIASSRDKAFQLKDLSDKLFQYFLVFGNNDSDRELIPYDASILFQQILSEHAAELISYEYKIDFDFTIPEVWIMGDISGLRRLFDNLFSNVMKYADKTKNILIRAFFEDARIKINIRNNIPENVKKVESTRIGVKTCEKICRDLNGIFECRESEEEYITDISFPIVDKPIKVENEINNEEGESE